ncbi:MAG: hypothetical protein Q8P51_15030 [Ignavibacteria bacterium]|nr:hypothetical protein [Ignavibacteria bacterium]
MNKNTGEYPRRRRIRLWRRTPNTEFPMMKVCSLDGTLASVCDTASREGADGNRVIEDMVLEVFHGATLHATSLAEAACILDSLKNPRHSD